MAGSEWGLSAWFDEGKEGVSQKGKKVIQGAGHIVKLRNELSERLAGKGTSQVKNKGLETHLDASEYYEKKAIDALKEHFKKDKDAQLYFDYFSKPQRDGKGDWSTKSDTWHLLDSKLNEHFRYDIQAYVDGYNKAQKFIVQYNQRAAESDDQTDTRDTDWIPEMIEYCDKMIELINKADPSFKNNALRNR